MQTKTNPPNLAETGAIQIWSEYMPHVKARELSLNLFSHICGTVKIFSPAWLLAQEITSLASQDSKDGP